MPWPGYLLKAHENKIAITVPSQLGTFPWPCMASKPTVLQNTVIRIRRALCPKRDLAWLGFLHQHPQWWNPRLENKWKEQQTTNWSFSFLELVVCCSFRLFPRLKLCHISCTQARRHPPFGFSIKRYGNQVHHHTHLFSFVSMADFWIGELYHTRSDSIKRTTVEL